MRRWNVEFRYPLGEGRERRVVKFRTVRGQVWEWRVRRREEGLASPIDIDRYAFMVILVCVLVGTCTCD